MNLLPLVLSLAALLAQDEPALSTTVRGEIGSKLDTYLSRLAGFGFSGAAVAAKGGEILLAKGYGLADREKGIPVGVDTVFTVGSITKQFTAAAILKLETEGKLSVTDPISKHFEGVPEDKKGITVHHLLTHSAGLRSDFVETDFTPVERDEYVRLALASDLLFEPGTSYAYANSGYSLLGAIVEKLTGKSYEAYLREALFGPAGMAQTGYLLPAWKPENLAQGYRDGAKWGTVLGRPMAADGPYWGLRANGGIHSTLGDMLRWHRALEGDRILPAAARAKLFTPHVAEDPQGSSHYGYGWAIFRTNRGTKLVAHNGGNGIFAADFHRYVDEDAVLFIASSAEVSAIAVSEKVARILFGEEVALPPEVARLDREALSKYAGAYRLPGGGRIVAAVAGDTLRLEAEAPDALALLMGASPGDVERHRGKAAQMEAVVRGASEGNYAPLHAALGGKMSLEEIAAMERPMWETWREHMGRLETVASFGRSGRGEAVTTTARLDFERGLRFVDFVWAGEEVVDIRARRGSPGREVRPAGDREFVSFEPSRSETWRARFDLDGDGRVSTLVVSAGGAEVLCPRER